MVSALCVALVLTGCGDLTAKRPQLLASCTGPASDILATAGRSPEMARIRDTLVVREAALSTFAPKWTRQAMLRVFVDIGAAITEVCLYESSGEASFDTAALTAVLKGEYDHAALNRVEKNTWVTFPVVTRIPAPPLQAGRYRPIARPEQVRSRYQREDVISAQAAVLNELIPDSISQFLWRGEQPEAICIGIGPDLPILDPSPELLDVLGATPLPLHPASECGVDTKGPSPPPLVLMEDGTPAMAYWVDVAESGAPTPLKVMAGFFRDGLTANGWDCFVDGTGDEWEVTGCRVTGVS